MYTPREHTVLFIELCVHRCLFPTVLSVSAGYTDPVSLVPQKNIHIHYPEAIVQSSIPHGNKHHTGTLMEGYISCLIGGKKCLIRPLISRRVPKFPAIISSS